MGYQGKRRFRVDLGVMHAAQPCNTHRDSGYQPGCDDCDQMPEKQVPVPHLHGFWVEVLNPMLLPYGRKKELYTPVGETSSPAELLARRERIVSGLITAWNLVPADEGEGAAILPLPKDDPTALDRAPEIVALVFAGILREQIRDEPVPKATATA